MAVKTRKEVREQIAVVLNAAMVGVGLPVQEIHDYMKTTFEGKSPVIVVGSSGFEVSEVVEFGGNWFPVYYFELLAFVSRDGGEAAAEDELDQVAQKLYETLEANQFLSGWWEALTYGERSVIAPAMVGGDAYWMEATTVRIEVFG